MVDRGEVVVYHGYYHTIYTCPRQGPCDSLIGGY
jgi:hypothetical protein